MTAPDDVRACPFCGNAKVEIHHNAQAGITFLLCGDDQGRGGCGAVVSFRPNLTGSKAVQAYNHRAAHADLSAEVRELVEGYRSLYRAYVNTLEVARDRIRELGGECDPVDVMERGDPALSLARERLAKFTHQEKP
jgi:hypothetical protein